MFEFVDDFVIEHPDFFGNNFLDVFVSLFLGGILFGEVLGFEMVPGPHDVVGGRAASHGFEFVSELSLLVSFVLVGLLLPLLFLLLVGLPGVMGVL